MVVIFPSIPRLPNPPGTRMPSAPARSWSVPSCSISSDSICRTRTRDVVGDAGVDERFVDRLVGVAVFGVLADDGDGDFAGGVSHAVEDAAPVVEVRFAAAKAELLADQRVEAVVAKADGDFVDRELLVAFFDDRFLFDVAEEGDLFAVGLLQFDFGAADEDVGLNADLPKGADAVLRGFRLRFLGGLQVRHQRQVDEETVLTADVEGVLADRFEEGQAFDVADGAADFGDDDVDVFVAEPANGGFDFVGDVRNDLHRLAEVFAFPLFRDDGLVDAAGGDVAVAIELGVGEAFVVAEVEVGFGAVVEDVDFAVLVGAHRAGIDVEVGIELLQLHAKSAAFEQQADRLRTSGLCRAS